MVESGQQLLHYRLVEKIGEGGMGVVWRGVDTTLDREVAIKILPEVLEQEGERLERFEREAKLLASLNHPNIAGVYGFHQADGVHFLAMELVPGGDLGARVNRGALPVVQALQSCRQIALGLDAAHERGVIHRDLKPGNVMFAADGKVKVLDFGLAKAVETASPDSSLSRSPTMTSAGTRAGMILGTAAYMSPEQARGQLVDKRTDVWAFGCVLYECLTGRPAFGGDTVSDVLASILKSEPDWSALSGRVSAGTVRLLRRCLEKDPAKRLRDIGDAGNEIDELLAGDPTAASVEGEGRRRASWGSFAAVGVLGVLAGALLWGIFGGRGRNDEGALAPSRLDIVFPAPWTVGEIHASPDGRSLLIGTDEGYFLRRLDGLEFRPLADTERCQGGTFSPDGRSIALFCFTDQILGQGKLQRISLEGGPTVTLLESSTSIGTPVWDGDSLWVGLGGGTKLARLPAGGGEPEVLVDLSDDGKSEALRVTQILPGRQDALALVGTEAGTHTELISLETGERRFLHEQAWPQYVSSGHLIVLRDETLMALPFDLESGASTGPAVPIVSGVARVELTPDGSLFYLPIGGASRGQGQVVLIDREGEERAATESAPMGFVRFSPNGKLASTVSSDITLHDFSAGTTRPLEFGELKTADHEWVPDGRAITYAGFGPEPGKIAIYLHPVDGRTPPTVLLEAVEDEQIFPTSWAPDGSVLMYARYAKEDTDLWLLPADGSEPQPLMATDGASEDMGRFSRDGRWIAYESNESGRQEIYVRSYRAEDLSVGPKWRISDGGGTDPMWSPDGSELYYETFDQQLVAVSIRRAAGDSGALAIGEHTVLFNLRELGFLVRPDQSYDVAPDGEHFAFIRSERVTHGSLRVVLNWFEELERLAPSER